MNEFSTTVLDGLYNRFYIEHEKFSSVTSSHWREIGGHKVSFENGLWDLRGIGFGSWLERKPINQIRQLGASLLVATMKRRYSCSDDLWKLGKKLALKHGRIFDYDCAKQVIAVDSIIKGLGADYRTVDTNIFSNAGIGRVCVIGDGYGYMGSLIKAIDHSVTITSVNLGRGLLFDAYHSMKAFPEAVCHIVGPSAECSAADFQFLPAEDYEYLANMPQDLVVNIASMQEMNLSVVNKYLEFMRRTDGVASYFYCCNRVEKELPGGEIVRFKDYGWYSTDEVVFDELCPWYQCYPRSFPFGWHPFDGPIWHRLTKLANRSKNALADDSC